MNASQVIAWLMCLLIAFFAAILAVHASVKLALLEREFAEVTEAATVQTAVLNDIRDILREIEGDLSKPAAPEATTE